MTQSANKAPKVLKETKKKIKVDFERTSAWKRFRLKYLSKKFIVGSLWWLFRFILLLGISYVILLPFFTKISSSFMSASDFADSGVKLIPKYPTLDTYKAIIVENGYFSALLNTFILSLSCALIQTFIACLVGYGLSKFKFKGSGLVFFLVIFTMVVPHSTIKFSMYMKFRYFDIYGLFKLLRNAGIINFTYFKFTDTFIPLLVLSLGGLAYKNGLFIFLMRQFFRGVPDELEESAYIDGYGVFKTFFRIVIPMSIPMMITVFLLSFSWQWTDNFYTDMFFSPLTSTIKLLPDIVKTPASMAATATGYMQAAITNAASLLIILPLIIMYLFCQKYLTQGIERSGIVG